MRFVRSSLIGRPSRRQLFAAPFTNILFVLLGLVALIIIATPLRQFWDHDIAGGDWWGQHSESTAVVITAMENDGYYWDAAGPFAIDSFDQRLANWMKDTPDPAVIIAADETARMGAAIRLLDVVRRHGIARVTVETRTRSTPQ
ncbi:MAG: biopolymer transporter ExbD [Candidatus Didemnitutus sp.]|nr:biopolymer transporter ExbD [Candidatus Didemnitutus sp.]